MLKFVKKFTILSDENVRVNFFVTFNEKDFSDVCKKRKIEILEKNFLFF